MSEVTPKVAPPRALEAADNEPVGGPVRSGWREGTLTRAKELESLCRWVLVNDPRDHADVLAKAVMLHVEAAREAAKAARFKWRPLRVLRYGTLSERAMSNLDAAEAQILNFAPAGYVLGQMPGLLRHVQIHLEPADPRRLEFERIAQWLGIKDPDHVLVPHEDDDREIRAQMTLVDRERGKIAATSRAASSAAMREQVRIRSFRNVIAVTTVAMALFAIGIGIIGVVNQKLVPLCFTPEIVGKTMVVCPTAQSGPYTRPPEEPSVPDIDNKIRDTTDKADLMVVELVGLFAATVAAAAAIRGLRGSSERIGLPIALALLKLPTGAITAFLGILLMRGNFVPGLSALDSSAQILAWALVFGYAQELFTRLVDRQGQSLLDSVRSADKTK